MTTAKSNILYDADNQLPDGITPHGGCYISTPAETTITNAGTFYLIAGTTTALHESSFTHTSPGRLTYNGTLSKMFFVTTTFSYSSSANNILVKTRIAKNGTTDSTTEQQFFKSNASDIKQTSCFGIISLSNNDYIECYITCDSAASTITAQNGVLVLNSI